MNLAPTDPFIGQTIDERYLVRTIIARGGMATVYQGDDLRLGRSVAIKIMHAHLGHDAHLINRFEQEARNVAGLSHPHVVNVFDQGSVQGLPYLVMEHLPGITLRDLLRQRQRLTASEAADISRAVLAGLAAAHDAGIIHRDLKPENVLLADDGRIKIGDFGLARAAHTNTVTGQSLLGTIAYLSPELVTRGIANASSDMYAFGIMLFELITGTQPYAGEQPMQIAYQHAHSEVPTPSSVASGISSDFDELVRWTTHRHPDARPQHAREALNYVQALPISAPENTARLPQTSAFTRTSVLPHSAPNNVHTAATALLQATAPGRVTEQLGAKAHTTALERVQAQTARRRRTGRWIAVIAIAAIVAATTAGWWWQQIGTVITVPDVAGFETELAQRTLAEASLNVDTVDCSSATIAAGLAVDTEPAAGTAVARSSTVRLCISTGPALLEVPTLIGLPLAQAEQLITEHGFTFGTVVAERFDDGEPGTVMLVLTPEGNPLENTYPELGVIDLIVSAGSVPEVRGLSIAEATEALREVGLIVDDTQHTEGYDDDIAEGHVLDLHTNAKPLDVGDTVSLHVSIGPELFEVPDVSEMRMRQAVELLREAGFEPTTGIPELLWGAITVSGTEPEAGSWARAGATVELHIDL